MTVDPTWQLGLALLLLLALTVGLSLYAKLGTAKDSAIAFVRSIIQLGLVSVIIVVAVKHVLLALAFVLVMLGVAVYTTAKRTGTLRRWPWVLLAVSAGVVPVCLIIYLTGTVPFAGISIIPIAGIIVGNCMTAHTLLGRRAFAALRDQHGQYEAGLAIGLPRADAIDMVISALLREALVPNVDTTKTVGTVTLPGAFIGVLLGGGSPLQAAAAQILVLFGIMAGQHGVVAVGWRLIRAARLLPQDLVGSLRP